MAKRSTIGENPLDTMIQGHPLDVVVPGPGVAGRGGQPLPAEVKERFLELEAALQAHRNESGQWRTETAALTGELHRVQGEGAQTRQEVLQLKAEVARLQGELARLSAACASLQADLTNLRGQVGPGDLPWWMGKRKK